MFTMNTQIIRKRTSFGQVEIIILGQDDLPITKKCLNLLYENTSDFSLIFIDNASSDGSIDFLNYFAADKDNMTLVRNEEDNGCIGGRNQGYQISCDLEPKADFICFLDNDQYVEKDWLDAHKLVMDFGKYDIVGAEAWVIHPQTCLPIRHNKLLNESFSYVGCGGMMVKRKVIEDVGLFDPTFGKNFFEDPDFCFKAYYADYKIGWSFRHKIKHVQQTTTITSPEKRKRFLFAYERFRAKWGGRSIPVLKQPHLEIW